MIYLQILGTTIQRHYAKFGNITEIRDSSGRGARFDDNGNFLGFLEP